MPNIVAIVEGDGEVAALPGLLRRVLQDMHHRYDINIGGKNTGIVNAHGRSKLLKRLEQFLGYCRMKKPDCAGILVLLDADDDCPVTLARQLAERCRLYDPGQPVTIVLAKREYEAWFLASLDTIKGNSGIPETASLTGNVEDIANPKQQLTAFMPPGQAYKETSHQAPFSQYIDLDQAHANSRSFRRLCHAVEELVDAIDSQLLTITPTNV